MRALRGLRTILMTPVFLIGTLFAATSVFVVGTVRRDSPVVDRIVADWSRFFLALSGCKLTVDGKDNIDTSRQYVFIANHLSNLDIPTMFLVTGLPIRYLAKAELFKIPVLKQAMQAMGIVRVDRATGPAMHSGVNAAIATAKKRGHSLIIFPEGSRAIDGELAPFKKGPFRIAITNGLDIIPVTLSGTWEAWTPGSKIVSGGPIRAVVHEPVAVAGLTLDNVEELRGQVHIVIAKEYESLREVPST